MMRQFVYLYSSGKTSIVYNEANVKAHVTARQYEGFELYELVPRAVKTVTTQEIV